MTINLSEDAVHALNRSAAAAAREGAEAVTPRHVLAGVLSERDPALLNVLASLGLKTGDLPPDLLDLPSTYEGHLPFTPESHAVLAAAVESAAEESERAGRSAATTSAHLLLGVARAADPQSSEELARWGLREKALASALEASGTNQPAASDGS